MEQVQLETTKGANFTANLTLLDTEGRTLNAVGFVFSGTIRNNPYAGCDTPLVINPLDLPNGNISITLDTGTTANMTTGLFNYTVTAQDPILITQVILSGKFVVYPSAIL